MESYERLEQNWAEFNQLDPKGMVACSSGTAALHLALEAFRLPQNSQVITSDFNMVAVPRAIALAGLQPVFVDCQDDPLINWLLVGSALAGGNVSAIIAVHIYGRQIPMPANCYKRYGTRVVEDLAEAHGVKPHPDTDAATWSFYKNKIVAGEEGGAVWFKDPEHAKLARQLRCLGFTDAHDFNHAPRGHNYRMSNLHAEYILGTPKGENTSSLLRYQLGMTMTARREREGWYDSLLPQEIRMPYRDAPWIYDIRISGMTAEKQTQLVRELNAAGIKARHAFKPMSRQEEFKLYPWYGKGHAVIMGGRNIGPESNADRLSREVIYLPLDPTISRSDCVKAYRILAAFLYGKETLLK